MYFNSKPHISAEPTAENCNGKKKKRDLTCCSSIAVLNIEDYNLCPHIFFIDYIDELF